MVKTNPSAPGELMVFSYSYRLGGGRGVNLLLMVFPVSAIAKYSLYLPRQFC